MASDFPPLVEMLADIPDPRHRQGRRYELRSILALLCAASLCGYRSYSAMTEWGQNYGVECLQALGFTRDRCPCKATLCLILRRLDVEALEDVLSRWVELVMAALGPPKDSLEAFAFDGKTLRGSAKQGARFGVLLAVLGHRLGISLIQRPVPSGKKSASVGASADDAHTNEIPVLKSLLKALLVDGRLEGRVFTMDAAHTQRENAETITSGNGDYVMPVKGNQPGLLEDIRTLFEDASAPAEWFQTDSQWDQGHGRTEYREIRTSSILRDYLDWPGAQQVFRLHRRTVLNKRKEQREDIVYGVTSLTPDKASPAQLLQLVRDHWAIENRLHWVRDVTFDEDRSQVRSGSTPQVMAAMRNLAITLMRSVGVHNIAAGCRQFAARPNKALNLIGATMEN